MRIAFTRAVSGIIAAALMAASSAGQTVPRPQSSAELTGHWQFLVTTGQGTTKGAMQIEAGGTTGLTGTVTTDRGNEVMPVRAVIRNGDHVEILVGTQHGDVVFGGALSSDARTFDGTVLYHNGQRFPMSGQKVQQQGQGL